MKDKNGVEINVGDVVEYRSPDTPLTIGKVTEVMGNAIKALWEDTKKVELVYTSEFVEVIKPAASIPAEQTVGFTQEDEAMLQMLLKRKKDHEEKVTTVNANFECALLSVRCATHTFLMNYFKNKQQAMDFCDTIKAYHEIN